MHIPFDFCPYTFSLEISLNSFAAFKVHSKGIPKGKMAGSKAHPMLEKTDP